MEDRLSEEWESLHEAAWENDAAEAERLLDEGADPTLRDSDGFTPLEIAALCRSGAVARVMLERGLATNIGDPQVAAEIRKRRRYEATEVRWERIDPSLRDLVAALSRLPDLIMYYTTGGGPDGPWHISFALHPTERAWRSLELLIALVVELWHVGEEIELEMHLPWRCCPPEREGDHDFGFYGRCDPEALAREIDERRKDLVALMQVLEELDRPKVAGE